MKRSEALELIDEVLFENDLPLLERIPEKILAKLEKAGMKPPIIKNPEVKQDTVWEWKTERSLDKLYSRENSVPEEFYVNQWEEE